MHPPCRNTGPWSAGRILVALILAAAPALGAQEASGTIVGHVTDARSGGPLAQVSVTVEGARLGATTGSDGQYRISGVSTGNHTVAARRIGYAVVRKPVTVVSGGPATVDFALEQAAVSLDQIVVTGTAGGQLRRTLGNAVATVDAADQLAKSGATNLASLLNARAPGLSIQPTTGRLGAGPAIQIRGRNSLSLANSPLIYIDGVRVASTSGGGPVGVTGGLGGQGSQVGGRLNDINPDDIESIEVINGPAAATIYGTEAAGGVIQVITKRGQAASAPAVAFRMEEGSLYFRDAAGRVPTNYAKDKAGNIVAWNGVQQEADSGRPVYKTGLTRQYNGSVSGGRDVLRYYAAAGYENDYGIEPNNALREFTSHANLTTQIGNNSDVTASLNFVDLSAHLGADQGVSPLIGTEYGHALVFPKSGGFYANFPPAVPQTLYDNSDGVNRFTGSVTVNNSPTNWFTQRAVVGIDYTGEDARALERYAPPELQPFLSAGQAGGRIGQTLNHNSIVTADYNGSAKFNLRPFLESTTSVGGQYYNTELNSSFLGGIGFPAPGVELVSAVATQVAATQTQTINTTIGAYAQQQFGWRDRLFLTGALRVDNNSAFGQDFKWVTYPKASASWVVNEEPWWRWRTINAFRLRAAYGQSGRSPNAFSALRTFTPVTGYNGGNGVTPGTLGNPLLKPERSNELEVGAEAGFLNRLALQFTYFSRHTSDEIVNQTVAPSAGFPGTRSVNLGRVDNSGIEAQATLQAITRRNVNWEIAANLGTNKDIIRQLGGVPALITSYGASNQVGHPISGIFSRKIFSADRDPTTGLAKNVLCDSAGTGVPCSKAPFQFLGTPTPKVTGAVANTVTLFGRLRLYALVDFKTGNTVISSVDLVRCAGLVLAAGLCRANYYPNEYPIKYVAEATTTAFLQNYVDQYATSGSFAKLRELSATYTIPDHWLRGVKGASFTLAARELHTWTSYNGIDPEAFIVSNSGTTNPNDQAVTPPLNRIIATLNFRW
jgi:TonB-linked SusC/RagA family outer membrane protein